MVFCTLGDDKVIGGTAKIVRRLNRWMTLKLIR